MKPIEFIIKRIKDAIFYKDETNIDSHKFNSVKVAVTTLVIIMFIFNIYAIRTLGVQINSIKTLKVQIEKEEEYHNCIKAVSHRLLTMKLDTIEEIHNHLSDFQLCEQAK